MTLALAGCAPTNSANLANASGDAGGKATVASEHGTLPCAVDAVLTANCRQCHGAQPAYGAPMPLVTLSDLTAPAKSDPSKSVFQLVHTRIHEDSAPMPQPPNPRLSASDAMTLDDWIAAGAPAANGLTCDGSNNPAELPAVTTACTPDVHLRGASPWAMPTNTSDIYICYGVDVPVTGARQVIGFQPHIDNSKIVHHVLVYASAASVSSTPTPCSGTAVTDKLLYGWAPGGRAFELPEVAGFPMDSGVAHYMVQVHYNNVGALAGQSDSTGFDLCTTDKLRPNEADVIAFGSMNFTIPSRAPLDLTCDLTIPSNAPPFHVISAFPHMHQLGTAIRTTATSKVSGALSDLGGVDNWSFGNQIWFPLKADVNPGDTLHTRCRWMNTTDAPVSYGENTRDEMCFSFTMFYPALPAIRSWAEPAFLSSCQTTPP